MALPERDDARLQQMNVSREEWEEVRAEYAARERNAPKVGERAPDFDLPRLDDRQSRARLSDECGIRPVALIFGSYT